MFKIESLLGELENIKKKVQQMKNQKDYYKEIFRFIFVETDKGIIYNYLDAEDIPLKYKNKILEILHE